VILFLRRHWIAPLKIFFIGFILALIPVLLYFVFSSISALWERESFMAMFILALSGYYLFVLLYTFADFVDYYLDVWIVTNERIINIEQKGLFARVISEKELVIMQDITSEIEGFWHTVFNYGDIFIQTAGEKERFVFKQVPRADEVARKISNLVSESRRLRQGALEDWN